MAPALPKSLAAALLLCIAGASHAAGRPLVCIAPVKTTEAGRAIASVTSLEFYVEEHGTRSSYGNQLDLVRSTLLPDGRMRNDYRIGTEGDVRSTIVFVGETPVSFAVTPLQRTYLSLQKDDAETGSLADAVPGIVCYDVEIATGTF